MILSEAESQKIENEIYDRLCSSITSEDVDPADIAERAQDDCIAFYETMYDIRIAIVNLFCAGLYHLFEQQILLIHRQELLEIGEENDPKLIKLGAVRKRLEENGINISLFRAWEKMEELRLVCNTVKHANGDSALKLKERKPSLFTQLDPTFIGTVVPHWPIYQPLSGQDFYVSQEDFLEYVAAVKDFWIEFMEGLEKQVS